MQVSFAAAARDDLLMIVIHGIQRHGLGHATAYEQRLTDVFNLLLENPRMGRARPEYGTGIRTLVIGMHIAFYRAVKDGIEILRIRHQHEDWLPLDDSPPGAD